MRPCTLAAAAQTAGSLGCCIPSMPNTLRLINQLLVRSMYRVLGCDGPSREDMTPRHGFPWATFGRRTRSFGMAASMRGGLVFVSPFDRGGIVNDPGRSQMKECELQLTIKSLAMPSHSIQNWPKC